MIETLGTARSGYGVAAMVKDGKAVSMLERAWPTLVQ
jgi:hypothetical protein